MPLMPLIQARRRTQLVAKWLWPYCFVQRACMSFYRRIEGDPSTGMASCGTISCSSRVRFCFGTGTMLASIICPRPAPPLGQKRRPAAALASRPGRCFGHPPAARFFEVPTSSAECLRLKDVIKKGLVSIKPNLGGR